MKQFTWVFLDADGTLFDYDKAEDFAIRSTFDGCGIPWLDTYAALYRKINAQVWREFEAGEITAQALRAERFRRMFYLEGISFDAEEFSERYLPNLARGNFLLPGAVELIDALRGEVRLALITNGLADVQRPRLAATPLAAAFELVAISEEVGAAKPDPAYFDWVLERAGNPAKDQVLVVGDSLSADIRGATHYGVPACWFNPQGKPLPEGLRPDWVISELAEVLTIVGLEKAGE